MLKVLICQIFYKMHQIQRPYPLVWEMLLELTEEITKLILQVFKQTNKVYSTAAIAILRLAVEWGSKWVWDSLEKVVAVVKTERTKPQLCHIGYLPAELQLVHLKRTKATPNLWSCQKAESQSCVKSTWNIVIDGDNLMPLKGGTISQHLWYISCLILYCYCFVRLSPWEPKEAGSFLFFFSVKLSLVSSWKLTSKATTPYTHWMWYFENDKYGTQVRLGEVFTSGFISKGCVNLDQLTSLCPQINFLLGNFL